MSSIEKGIVALTLEDNVRSLVMVAAAYKHYSWFILMISSIMVNFYASRCQWSKLYCKVHGEIEGELSDEANVADPCKGAVSFESAMFEKRGRSIVEEVTSHSSFSRDNIECTGREGISPLLKCTSASRQLAYNIVPDFLDEYLQMSDKTSRLSLDYFCSSVMENFGLEYLRKPTMNDVVKLYRHHEEKHGFLGMLGSLDNTD
ncbi:hypothetical protein Tco_1404822 [Tanacetum coccineum]